MTAVSVIMSNSDITYKPPACKSERPDFPGEGVMTFDEWLNEYTVSSWSAREKSLSRSAWEAAVKDTLERCAAIAEKATIGLTGFVESDRMEFAVKNMHKLRQAIADKIRAAS